MKKVLLWIGITIFGLIALVMVGGMFLPDRYEAHVVVKVNKSPEAVWAAISDFEKYPLMGAMRKTTQRLPDENGLPVWIEDAGETRVRVQVVAATPPSHIKWVFGDQVVPMRASSETRIEPVDGGSLITTNSETTITSGTWHVPVFRVILWLTAAHEKGVRDYWTSIAKGLGETPQFAEAR